MSMLGRICWPKKLLAGFTLLFVLLGFLSLGNPEWWSFDLLANFRIHIIVTSAILLSVWSYYRKKGLSACLLALLCLNVWAVLSVHTGTERISKDTTPDLVVLTYNLGASNRESSNAIQFLVSHPADIIVLQEYTHEWHKRLQSLERMFPHVVAEPRDGFFGIALFSRVPLQEPQILEFPETDIPFVRTRTTVAGQHIIVLGVHLDWPLFPSTFGVRNRQIKYLVSQLQQRDSEVLVCGDWNLSPWSGQYREVLKILPNGGEIGTRMKPTWPSVLGWAGIPIDYCLMSEKLSVVRKEVVNLTGSDHLPVSFSIVNRMIVGPTR